jgi:hypothetical protein
MSASNAAARKRRAPPSEQIPVTTNVRPSATPTNSGIPLHQVISIIDTRLIKLETFMKDLSNNNVSTISSESVSNQNNSIGNDPNLVSEFNSRFEILAEEIGNLKDIVLNLQRYTMDVNKTLLEERVRIFSDFNGLQEPAGSTEIDSSSSSSSSSNNNISINLQNLVSEELRR